MEKATEIARRSDSLYFDKISRRELCDMVAYLENRLRELDRLKSQQKKS